MAAPVFTLSQNPAIYGYNLESQRTALALDDLRHEQGQHEDGEPRHGAPEQPEQGPAIHSSASPCNDLATPAA